MVLRRLRRGTFCIPPPRAPEEWSRHAPVTEFCIRRRTRVDTGREHACAGFGTGTHASRALNIEIARGAEVVAQIVPAGPPRAAKLADLDERFAQLPKLDAEDGAAFEDDLLTVRGESTAPEPEWD